jgi:hypothetical protein
MFDVFRPSSEPARTLYDTFQSEALKRGGRSPDEWIAAERQAVYAAACRIAQETGLKTPTLDEVMRAERSACGHVDYGSKWAYGVSSVMREGA